MKLNKLFILGLMASVALFTACSDDDDDYAYGPEVAGNNINNDVTFATASNIVLNLTDTSFDVILQRPDSVSAQSLTVPIETGEVADVFTVPQSVTFEAGASTAALTIQVSDKAEPFVKYPLNLSVPGDFSYSTYKAGQTSYPAMGIIVYKEDYTSWGVFDWHHDFFADWNFDVAVEYSEYLDLYRMDIFEDGYTFYMKLDEEKGSVVICDSEGKAYTGATPAGFTYSDYGMVYATWVNTAFTGWDDEDQAYFIPFKWTVAAGSFGSNYDWFTIKSKV